MVPCVDVVFPMALRDLGKLNSPAMEPNDCWIDIKKSSSKWYMIHVKNDTWDDWYKDKPLISSSKVFKISNLTISVEVKNHLRNGGFFWMMINFYLKSMWFGNQPIKNGGWTSRVCWVHVWPAELWNFCFGAVQVGGILVGLAACGWVF